MQKPDVLDTVLLRVNMPFQKLHKLWLRSENGSIEAMVELATLSAAVPSLGVVLEWFRANKNRKSDTSGFANKPSKVNAWGRLLASDKSAGATPGGLPSLGKRR